MNRRGLFSFLSIAPAVAIGTVVANPAPTKIELDLPKDGDTGWGHKINDAFRKIEDAINERKVS